MKRILSWGSVFAFALMFGLTGCDGGAGDMAEGVPKNAPANPEGGVTAPPGSPSVSVDMTKVGNKPKKVTPPAGATPPK
jgi:hypothetical protein